jgi:DNA-binding MarR family transcriptional regulator
MMDDIQSTANDQAALSILAAGLRPFKEMGTASKSSFPISLVSAFMLVATHEGRTVSELARTAGVHLPKMSRQLADLSDVNRYGAPGLGLIEQRVDIQDNRFMRSRLTVKGQSLVRQIAGAMDRTAVRAA